VNAHKKSRSSYLHKRLRAFACAFAGIVTMLREEPHAKIHALATVIVITLGIALHVTCNDWLWLTVAITMVWVAEAFNASIERLADRITVEQDLLIGHAKDMASAAVLLASVGAAVIGSVVFVTACR
jgi:diacylglycerol kinase